MNLNNQKPSSKWGLFSIFLIVTTVFSIFGAAFITGQKENFAAEKRKGIEAVASLNVEPILQLRIGKSDVPNSLRDIFSGSGFLIIIFVSAFGVVTGWMLWRRRDNHYMKRSEAGHEKTTVVKQIELILKYANDIIFLIDKDLNIIELNDRALEVYQYTREEMIGLNVKFLRPDDMVPKLIEMLVVLEDRKSATYETIHRKKDGTVFPIEISVRLVEIEDQKYYHTIGRDISERKKIEIQIEESNSLLLATLESTADGILVVDLEGKIVQFNTKFAEMWKIPESITASRDDEKAISFVRDQLNDPDSFVNNVRHLYQNPEAVSFDVLNFRDGRIFERYSQPQKINNSIVGRVWSFRDITLRKTAEDQLISAKEKAEESNQLKSAFLHNISHEIRTPMNAIVGFTALLDDNELTSEARRQYIDTIYQSSNQLLSIITDIVDISNVVTGQAKVHPHEVNINTIIRNLFDQYRIRAAQRKLSIHYTLFLPEEKALLQTDRTKLIQILSNLLDNALKFTTRGKIEIGYIVEGSCVVFTVSDTGIGISKDNQSKIFDRFYQIESSTVRQYGGTGLGLSICKAYAELLGGSIRVESEPESGTTFYLTLPFKIQSKHNINTKMDQDTPNQSFIGKTILIAEDDDINYLVVEQTLKSDNLKLIRAVNGAEAVEICRSNSKIDLVLLDLKMPVMDGLEAMKRIREFRPDLPFVALTAYAFESDKRNAMEQGCVDYISKPFSKKILLKVMEKHL